MLQLCVSQQINTELYFAFKATGVRVYSFEEALYHTYHYWQESSDDLLSDEMVTWVGELGLSYLAARMKELTHIEAFMERMLSFLQLIDYFSKTEIAELKTSLQAWEERREWEKLKERADFFARRGEPIKALPLYKRALGYEENSVVLNNLGVICMQLHNHAEAVQYLARAVEIDKNNLSILLAYTEATILNKQYEHANETLKLAELSSPNCADILFMRGLMALGLDNYIEALGYFEKAWNIDKNITAYAYKIVEIYITTRQYSKALTTLEQIKSRNGDYYSTLSDVYFVMNDIPAAIKALNQALEIDSSESSNSKLWVKLARYYRLNYDLERAETAIATALHHAPDSSAARLENARIKKGRGRTRDYQTALLDVLKGFKARYRSL